MPLLQESNFIFCLGEGVKMFIIILPLTPRLLNVQKLYQKVPISLQNRLSKSNVILTFFKELFSMLPKALDHK